MSFFEWNSKIYQLIKLSEKLNKTAFYLAVEKENLDIIKLLLSYDKIDINIPHVFNKTSFIILQIEQI